MYRNIWLNYQNFKNKIWRMKRPNSNSYQGNSEEGSEVLADQPSLWRAMWGQAGLFSFFMIIIFLQKICSPYTFYNSVNMMDTVLMMMTMTAIGKAFRNQYLTGWCGKWLLQPLWTGASLTNLSHFCFWCLVGNICCIYDWVLTTFVTSSLINSDLFFSN